MHYFLYLFNVLCSSGQTALGKQYARNGGESECFNINKAFSGFLVFLVIGILGGLQLHIPTIIFGIACGFILSVANHTGFKALSLGSIALTSTLVSFSLIIPLIFGITFLQEKISEYGMLGIFLLCISIVMMNLKKGIAISSKWVIYTFMTLVLNGIYSIIQKYHQSCFPNQYRIEFLITTLFIVLVMTFIFSRQKLVNTSIHISFEALSSGIMNGLSSYIVLYLAATENASVLFPVCSVAQIITTCLIGRFAFSERLKLLQIFGIVIGIMSIILLNFQ